MDSGPGAQSELEELSRQKDYLRERIVYFKEKWWGEDTILLNGGYHLPKDDSYPLGMPQLPRERFESDETYQKYDRVWKYRESFLRAMEDGIRRVGEDEQEIHGRMAMLNGLRKRAATIVAEAEAAAEDEAAREVAKAEAKVATEEAEAAARELTARLAVARAAAEAAVEESSEDSESAKELEALQDALQESMSESG